METKHTPGPWKTTGYDLPNVHVYGPGKYPAVVAYCPALVNAGGAGTTPDERVANARLIAAAPDGLNAAQFAYLALLKHDHDAWRVKNQGVYCALRDFIAKATGQTSEAVQDAYELAALNEACAAIAKATGHD